MESKNNMEMLLSNFRFSEAVDEISSLVNAEKISAKRGETCKKFILSYEQVVRDSLWNEEGIRILSANKIDDVAFKDIENERNRLISVIDEWLKSEKRLLLFFVSAYYAVSNLDGARMSLKLDDILKEINDDSLTAKISRTLGGYEQFQAVGNALENYCHLNGTVFEIIKNLTINMQP